jgi:RNA polymerase sigma-70 factor (ECF subfamily)
MRVEEAEGMVADDAALAHAASSDDAAWDALYRRYVGRIYRYLHLHGASADDAADLTQQVFMQAFAALAQDRSVASVAPWLFRIAHNVLLTARQRQRPTVPWEAVPEAWHPTDEGDPAAQMIQQENLMRLRRLVAQLAPDKRELLALRFAGQLSFGEIAQVVGKQEDAVKKQIYRIVQGLKERYHDDA